MSRNLCRYISTLITENQWDLNEHARRRMRERKIPACDVHATLVNPESVQVTGRTKLSYRVSRGDIVVVLHPVGPAIYAVTGSFPTGDGPALAAVVTTVYRAHEEDAA